MLEIQNAVCGYRRGKKTKTVIEGISLSVDRGEIMCILGANGIGKTTLFRSVLGGIPLLSGSVNVDGRDLSGMSIRERARKIGYVPQSHTPPFPFTVMQVAVMGRTAHMQMFATPSAGDLEAAERALALMGIDHLKDEPYTEISGGERQLVLNREGHRPQESDYLIMDEPTSNLDFGNRIRVLRRVRQLAETGRGVIMTTHDPDHAFSVASKVSCDKERPRLCDGSHGGNSHLQPDGRDPGIRTGVAETTAPDGRRVKTAVGYL